MSEGPRPGRHPIQTYEDDIVAWANEQARLLREGQFDRLDITHIAEEIDDVGKSEQRELARRMAVLLAHLLKWRYQPEQRDPSWEITICNQRNGVRRRLAKTPSLKADLGDAEWWDDATIRAVQETRLTGFPEHCPCRS
ncbi:DUF29 domain-containing protein [Thiocapsa bogorovii]|uniref:DUF29 domain-containing protein n=1 Tax=Thiocapsa bogorovii TaxID=521689 RepID=UPI002FCB3DB4